MIEIRDRDLVEFDDDWTTGLWVVVEGGGGWLATDYPFLHGTMEFTEEDRAHVTKVWREVTE